MQPNLLPVSQHREAAFRQRGRRTKLHCACSLEKPAETGDFGANGVLLAFYLFIYLFTIILSNERFLWARHSPKPFQMITSLVSDHIVGRKFKRLSFLKSMFVGGQGGDRFFCFCFFGCDCGICKFPGQGWNPSLSSDNEPQQVTKPNP